MKRYVFLLLTFITIYSQELIDGIAAIVDDNIILYSEVEQLARLNASQMGINPEVNKEKYQKLRELALNALIEDKILVEQAKIESIEVSDREVEEMLNQKIEQIIKQAGSQQKAENLLGGPLNKIKRDYRPIIKNMILVQKLKSKKFQNITLTRQEVEKFYETYKDSIPEIPPTLDFSHILIEIRPGNKENQEALSLIDSLRELILNGHDFSELAKKYSDDPATAPYGGDLGFIQRGDFITSFEEAAFSLEPDEVSDIIKTELGYHIIQLVDRKGEKIRVRHILIKPKISQENIEQARMKIYKIKKMIENKEISFDSAAYKYSDDPDAKINFGRIERIPKNQIKQKEFITILDTLKVDEISEPFRTEMGFHILKLNGVYNDMWITLEQYALQLKQMNLYLKWIEELKKNFYIEIKLK